MDFSKKQLQNRLNSQDKKIATDALLYLTFNIDDFDWVQDICIEMVDNKDEDISGLAITCIGHLAKIYSKIDRKKVLPVLSEKAKDNRFTGRVEDALDDIEMFTT